MKYIGAIVIFVTLLFCANISYAGEVIYSHEQYNKEAIYVQESYKVGKDETLDTITDEYIKKNTYGKREHKEFKQGIIELNQWLLVKRLEEGDVLDIRYWRKYIYF